MSAALSLPQLYWSRRARVNSREAFHDPVMLEEVQNALNLKPGCVVVDGTLGLGGHASAMIQKIAPGGTLVGMDWDESMLAIARERLGNPSSVKVVLVHDDFRNLSRALEGLDLRANGILLDLGLNSAQVDDPSRGISFLAEGPLDMRMDTSRREPASALLNRAAPETIARILREFGDERFAGPIARKIVERRKEKPLRTTSDLVDCVLAAIPPRLRDKRIHPATRTFQAVRCWVTGELDDLKDAIMDAARSLAIGGTLVILSYHSGEDREAKHACRELAESGEFEELNRKPLLPSEAEIQRNSRSRSAKMRTIRRKALENLL